MSAFAWERAKEILHQAMQLAPEQRPGFLDQACSSDAAMRAEVESLLLAGEEIRNTFLESPPSAANLLPDRDDAFAGALAAGQIFAQRFQLVRKLGQGGMGQVWLADQTSPVRRQVALKLIKAGMYDESVVQRFQSERQSIAIMDHPAIAKVFDAGATPQGQPYFVMEYVPGLPITEYCDQKRLKIADRLELFIQACEGVQHAHQKAIIHRDLKPANILVVDVDGKPTARIIDFGLAKAVTPQLTDESLFTQRGLFVGTPGYMSPEQADTSVRDIDTRTDVYSLGVVLYVLLAGVQPFDTRQQKQSFEEFLRMLREDEPPLPSTRVASEKASSAATAAARSTEPGQLVKLLRGDLDWIAMKALEKDRARRYGTPSELVADIRRHLNHLPVVARPGSVAYHVRKYVRRHRVAVGVAIVFMLAGAAFTALQAAELLRITRERDRADRERDRATRVTDFMTGMFKVSDPGLARGNSVTAREILDKASNDIGTGLARDPQVQAQMMQVMARTYVNLGLYARAEELARRAMNARMTLLGPNDPKTLESMTQLGLILHREGHAAEAEKLERQAYEGTHRVLGPDDPLTLESEDYLASALVYLGRFDEAEKLEREVVERATRVLGPDSDRTLRAMDNLGSALLWQRRHAEAEQEYRQLLAVAGHTWGPENPGTLRATSSLATSLAAEGRLAEAEPLDRSTLVTEERVLGPDHPLTGDTRESLAYVLSREGKRTEAERLYRESLASRIRTSGPESSLTLFSKHELADLLYDMGRYREAEILARETLEAQVRTLGPENLYALRSKELLASILIKEGNYAEAADFARGPFEARMRNLGPEHAETLGSLRLLGTAMALNHQYADADKLFRGVIARQNNSGGQGERWTVWYDFACVAVAAGHPEDALQYLRDAIDRGFKDADALAADDNLKGLRKNPDFQELFDKLRHSRTKSQP
jgi:serine/threonine protein kinase/tetratricopeptide (TPR) repeat protein